MPVLVQGPLYMGVSPGQPQHLVLTASHIQQADESETCGASAALNEEGREADGEPTNQPSEEGTAQPEAEADTSDGGGADGWE
eukprot:scaffold367470_cov20-Prasinocladus_malaysianus.AAC.1